MPERHGEVYLVTSCCCMCSTPVLTTGAIKLAIKSKNVVVHPVFVWQFA